MAFERIIKRLTSLNIPQIIRTTLRPSLGLIADLQREQLFAGIDSFGEPIIPEYSTDTIRRKGKKSPRQPTDRVTLKDTGKFYKGIKGEIKDQKITVTSRDLKTEMLKGKYGDKILGLTDENIALVLERARQPLIQRIQKILLS